MSIAAACDGDPVLVAYIARCLGREVVTARFFAGDPLAAHGSRSVSPEGRLWDNSRVAGSKRRTSRPVEKPRIGRPVEKRSKLGDWVDAHGWTRQQLAEALGIAFGTATRLCSGARRPSLETAIQIEDLTDGAVSVRSWLEVPAHTKG